MWKLMMIRKHAFAVQDNKVLFGLSDKGWHEEIFMIDDDGNEISAKNMSVNKFGKLLDAGKIVLK